MPDLSTQYMKLTLRNPVIISSSGLTKSIDKIKAGEEAGAGAVVLKSLFEEVLAGEDFGIQESVSYHAEAYDYLRSELELQYGSREYLDLIREAKKSVDIPVIASINCVSAKWWPNFAAQIEKSGADALELNVFKTATDITESGNAIEQMYFDILDTVKSKVRIPVSLKIGSYFSALPNFASRLDKLGVDALVLFNRFTEPDIDINKLELKTTFEFSQKYELYKPLRWTALLSGILKCDISATTGIKTAEDVIKLLLAGAATVQLGSVLYKNGFEVIDGMLKEISAWMERHDFQNIDQFRGKLSFAHTKAPDMYLRNQFMEKIRGVE
ncbi:dihydroorotate dehydrogenase-like protein [candidate division KSB1 bacterium]|nr:dihydroorotate dehydrogenase-like protein [candidate division KSB1 bacterium]